MQHTTTHKPKRIFPVRFIQLYLLMLLSVPALAQAPFIRYVTPNGTGDGSSWASASGNLQASIDAVALAGGGEVWVAAGIYKPTAGNDRGISFSMKNDVAIYGGFMGNESCLSQRPAVNPVTGQASTSILSGDIDENGLPDGNSYHIIFNRNGINTSAVLDGFVITGGNANGRSYPNSYGGGIVNNGGGWGNSCSPTVRNCLLLDNRSDNSGGAICNIGSGDGNSSPVITSCLFQNNKSNNPDGTSRFGGAIYNNGEAGNSNTVLTNCSFKRNEARIGGAILNHGYRGYSRMEVLNCSFEDNTADYGGAIAILGDGTGIVPGTTITELTNCSFQGNMASRAGGAIYGRGQGATSFLLTNCVVFGNGGSNTMVNEYGASTLASHSLFETGVSGYSNDGHNIVAPTSPFMSTTSTHLKACTPAIDAGDNTATQLSGLYTDLAGNPRIVGGRIDMGAYEFQYATITNQPALGASVCTGSNASASVSATGTPTYQWFRGETALSGQNSPSLTLTNVQAEDGGSYTMVITDGCYTSASDPYVLTINPLSVGGSVSGSTTVCTGSNSTALLLNDQVGTTQTWQSSTNNGSTWTDLPNTANSSSYTATNLTQTARYRAVVQSGVCAPAYSAVATVTVSQPPVVEVGSCRTIYLGYGESCATLTATADQSNLNYSWEGGLSGANVQVCPTVSTTYTVTATNAAGCTATATTQVEVLDIRSIDKKGKVEIWLCDGKKSKTKKPEDVAKYLAKGYTLGACGMVPCSGIPAPIAISVATSCNVIYEGYGSSCLTLEATATGGYGELRFNWGPGLTGSSVEVCPDKKTKYTLTVTDQHGYLATEEVEVDLQNIRCGKDKAGVELCFQGKNICVAAGEVAGYLTRGARPGKCSDKPCKEDDDDDDDRSRQGVAEELNELPVELAVEAYPNPSSGQLTLQVRTSYTGPGLVEVLDLTGRSVQNRSIELQAGDNTLELDVARQPSGLYLLRVRDAAGRQGAVRISKH